MEEEASILQLLMIAGVLLICIIGLIYVWAFTTNFFNQEENDYCIEKGYKLSGHTWEFKYCYKQTDSGAYQRVQFVKIGNEFKELEENQNDR